MKVRWKINGFLIDRGFLLQIKVLALVPKKQFFVGYQKWKNRKKSFKVWKF